MIGIDREEINKKNNICKYGFIGVIGKNVKVPMLVYDEEKQVVKEALIKYRDELESELRGR